MMEGTNEKITEHRDTKHKDKEKKITYHQGSQATPVANSSGIGYLMTLANTTKEIHLETNNKRNFLKQLLPLHIPNIHFILLTLKSVK